MILLKCKPSRKNIKMKSWAAYRRGKNYRFLKIWISGTHFAGHHKFTLDGVKLASRFKELESLGCAVNFDLPIRV